MKTKALSWTIVGVIFLSVLLQGQAKRVLVIGNADYQNLRKLRNPTNDAADMADMLRKLGFEVTMLTNAKQGEMEAAFLQFKRGLMGTPHEVGLFYYSGHGMDADGKNYLLPIESDLAGVGDILTQGVSVDKVAAGMNSAGKQINIIILDACRTVFEGQIPANLAKDIKDGLAPMVLPKAGALSGGSIVVYATLPGNIASDGTGRNGLFTTWLLTNMEKPELEITRLIMNVRNGVLTASGGKQEPQDYNTKRREFYFVQGIKPDFRITKLCVIDSRQQQKSVFEPAEGMLLRVEWAIVKAGSEKAEYKMEVEGEGIQTMRVNFPRLSEGNWTHNTPLTSTNTRLGRHTIKATLWIGNESRTESTSVKIEVKPVPVEIKAKPVSPGVSSVYGLPPEVWNNCQYKHDGEWMIDMTTKYWANLSVLEQQKYAAAYQKGYADAKGLSVDKTFTKAGAIFEMRLIPPARFWMGSPDGKDGSKKEEGRNDDEVRHRVVISKPFWMQKTEITQKQWCTVTENTPWAGKPYMADDRHAAAYISWNGIHDEFLAKLGSGFALPTEAQWEYACRAGTLGRFYWGDSVAEMGQYANVADKTTKGKYSDCSSIDTEDGFAEIAPAGSLKPNAYGLHDMIGNVWEWCKDGYADYEGDSVDPTGSKISGSFRVFRGGSWFGSGVGWFRSAFRGWFEPSFSGRYLGARVVFLEVF